MSSGAFDQLHPALQYHVVNSLGWSSLRPTQLGAITPILAGKDCLILAPTAGGKTEAAVIPVLSRALLEDWRGLGILYVCPIKALLNNLEERLSCLGALVGRRVQLWHGDINQSAKARALRDPPDLLLTTPESLEGMLISQRVDKKAWFGGLKVVVVDELHAFAGDDRGWHLRAVLGRLDKYAPRRMQRIGLSATLGNPKAMLTWFSGSEDAVVVGESFSSADADVTIDHVGTLEGAATIISRLHRGAKRLVFCDSRARVEELGSDLRARGVRTFLSHSSLSVSERKQAERAFAEEPDCVIVATSTLELGIDVGDLDYVFQIDAPVTVSSFLQRMGRTARRSGARRNCLFLTTSDESFLIACGVVELWKQGYVEPVVPPGEPWHIVAQQIMGCLLEMAPMGKHACISLVRALFPELSEDGIRDVLHRMVAADVLAETEGALFFGHQGERLYGRQNFVNLVSSFESRMQFLVRHGSVELGYVDPAAVRYGSDGEKPTFLLGGHSWRVTGIEPAKRLVWVEPAPAQGRASWFGSSRSIGFDLCQAVQRVLVGPSLEGVLSKRAQAKLQELLASLPAFAADATTLEQLPRGRTRWWTFAGARANAVLAASLHAVLENVKIDDFYLEGRGSITVNELSPVGETDIAALAQKMTSSGYLDVKFKECLPAGLAEAMVACRGLDLAGASAIYARKRAAPAVRASSRAALNPRGEKLT